MMDNTMNQTAGNSGITGGRRICLLDLNYTLVSNQMDTRMIRPFSRRMEGEEYRMDLIDAIRGDYVIIVTARPDYQRVQTMQNILKKTGWEPVEVYFNDIDAEPHIFKESALKRFIFPKYGMDGSLFYAVESNPKTRAMYKRYGIHAEPYSEFIKKVGADGKAAPAAPAEPEMRQLSLFD